MVPNGWGETWICRRIGRKEFYVIEYLYRNDGRWIYVFHHISCAGGVMLYGPELRTVP